MTDTDVEYQVLADTYYSGGLYFPRFILIQGDKTIEDIYWMFDCADKKTAQMVANSYFDEVVKMFSERYGLHGNQDAQP